MIQIQLSRTVKSPMKDHPDERPLLRPLLLACFWNLPFHISRRINPIQRTTPLLRRCFTLKVSPSTTENIELECSPWKEIDGLSWINGVSALHCFLVLLCYGVVPKGLLTFLGTHYKEVAETTPQILVYRCERQTARKNISSFQKHCVLNLECRILSQEPSYNFILYLNVVFHWKKAEEDANRPLVTSEYCTNWFPWFFATVGPAIEVDTII